MEAKVIYDDQHQWILFGRDPEKPDNLIDTNQFMIVSGREAIILDPGGIELFAPMLAAVLKFVPVENIRYLFSSHQDPDIISSLGLWDEVLRGCTLHCPWLWEGFVRHFGMNNIGFAPIRDEGGSVRVGDTELQFIPAHYLHSSGNFHVYDPKSKIYFSGDVGAALEDPGAPLDVDDFEAHIPKMEGFHKRWMPSNTAKQDWIKRVRQLDIEILAPQHGRMFRGENVTKFLDWFEQLKVGSAVQG
ncbi:MAG: FprA family A-type flavoprotein, partial [Pseudomonadales bacterium]|nr:FprA family A-type flavoprotein [Pseudomonadales bacterium]